MLMDFQNLSQTHSLAANLVDVCEDGKTMSLGGYQDVDTDFDSCCELEEVDEQEHSVVDLVCMFGYLVCVFGYLVCMFHYLV